MKRTHARIVVRAKSFVIEIAKAPHSFIRLPFFFLYIWTSFPASRLLPCCSGWCFAGRNNYTHTYTTSTNSYIYKYIHFSFIDRQHKCTTEIDSRFNWTSFHVVSYRIYIRFVSTHMVEALYIHSTIPAIHNWLFYSHSCTVKKIYIKQIFAQDCKKVGNNLYHLVSK